MDAKDDIVATRLERMNYFTNPLDDRRRTAKEKRYVGTEGGDGLHAQDGPIDVEEEAKAPKHRRSIARPAAEPCAHGD
jgi:hypothetical protein